MSEETRRLELQQKFEDILGTRNVYFQPPETLSMKYPCIVYFKDTVATSFANNKLYKYKQGYTVTYIDEDPDSEIPFNIIKTFEYSRINSFYRSEGLNHTKLTIFY